MPFICRWPWPSSAGKRRCCLSIWPLQGQFQLTKGLAWARPTAPGVHGLHVQRDWAAPLTQAPCLLCEVALNQRQQTKTGLRHLQQGNLTGMPVAQSQQGQGTCRVLTPQASHRPAQPRQLVSVLSVPRALNPKEARPHGHNLLVWWPRGPNSTFLLIETSPLSRQGGAWECS